MRVYLTLTLSLGVSLLVGCGDTECGAGTELVDGRCLIVDAGADGSTSDSSVPDAQVDASRGGDQVSCSNDTLLVNGKCVAKKPVGAGCLDSNECQSGTCAPAADNLPGGMCTVLGCSEDNPCPNGSTCYALNKSLSLCMAYCDRSSSCRTDENYHCQPLYTNDLNICAPSCQLTKSCTSGTRCNTESGLCEVAECDVNEPKCAEQETCWPDPKGVSSKGGLCLHLCEVAHPEKTCKVDQNEVCQPLENDPSKGFCAPPVCTKNSECPAGAECANHVCLPPASCGDNGACPDDRTCVSGKCMRKCPTDDKKCSDVHPDLVCADVLAVPACLPLGAFPGSACKPTADNRCASLTVGGAKVAMACENDTCLAECATGGDTLCSALSPSLQCARGIFSKDLCLPKGSYPGSACGANNSCAQDLNGDPAVDMRCVSGTCAVGCAETNKWPGYGDALCSLVDASLTCAAAAGAICVRACGEAGVCQTGFSCLDAGAVASHENACLPTGSFPGSPCRPASGDQCDSNVGGNEAVDLVCLNNACVVACVDDNDALCQGVDSRLTCAESAGNVCVFACGQGGACPTGYSCLDAGGENACLPTGAFPSSPCRTTQGDECDQNLGGNADADMACVGGQCVLTCPNNNDATCSGFDARLTCAEDAGNLCVFACGQGGACPTGYACLDPGGENACLPIGTFPGSVCRSEQGNECDQNLGGNANVDMTCVNNTCVVPCPSNNDALCSAVSSRLTCAESANNICVIACGANGACPTGYACLDPGNSTHQNACLPNGTFPGSPCRTEQGNQCDQNLGGNNNVDMACVNNACVVQCPSNNDALCQAVNAALTCAEDAGNICVVACQSGVCPSGYSCLKPGSENACLPNGTFPGSACRSDPSNQCDQNLNGNPNVDMACAGGRCAVQCPNNADALCQAVSSALTCFSPASLCVPACMSGNCPQGYTCNSSENACIASQ